MIFVERNYFVENAQIIFSPLKAGFKCVVLFSRSYLKDMFSRHRSAAEGVTRSRSLKKTLNTPTAIKKNSHCLQLIYQVVSRRNIILLSEKNFNPK